MIARVWTGSVAAAHADEYFELMRSVALPDYRRVPGNAGAWCLRRRKGEVVEIVMLTFWRDMAAVRGFAGDTPERAKYYDFDRRFLQEMREYVDHFEVHG